MGGERSRDGGNAADEHLHRQRRPKSRRPALPARRPRPRPADRRCRSRVPGPTRIGRQHPPDPVIGHSPSFVFVAARFTSIQHFDSARCCTHLPTVAAKAHRNHPMRADSRYNSRSFILFESSALRVLSVQCWRNQRRSNQRCRSTNTNVLPAVTSSRRLQKFSRRSARHVPAVRRGRADQARFRRRASS